MKKIVVVLGLLFFAGCDKKCPDNNKFCHYNNDLHWSDISEKSMDIDDATEFCQKIGGRLPTISELRSLIKSCADTESSGNCPVTDDFNVDDLDSYDCSGCKFNQEGKYSVFDDSEELMSGTLTVENDEYHKYFWVIDFALAEISESFYYKNYFFRCVNETP